VVKREDARSLPSSDVQRSLVWSSAGKNHPDLDYSEISPRLQWLRGPHRLEAALTVFHKHQGIPWGRQG